MAQDPRFPAQEPKIGPRQPSPLDWLTSSLIPDELVEGAQDYIDSPSLDREPWQAQLEGFGAGALGGLADMATPLGLGLAAAGGVAPSAFTRGAGASRSLARAGRGANPMRGQNSSSQALQALKKATPEGPPPTSQTAGMRDPSFTAVGEEAAYNMGRPPAQSHLADLYELMSQKFGMGRPPQ